MPTSRRTAPRKTKPKRTVNKTPQKLTPAQKRVKGRQQRMTKGETKPPKHIQQSFTLPDKYRNKPWKARSSAGRKPLFADPDQLLACCIEYFEWAHENPLWEARLVSNRGEPDIEYLPKMRILSLAGLCMFLDIVDNTWRDYKENKECPEFSRVCRWVDQAIYEHKYSGASSGFYNAAIIARDLGLADKREVTGKDGKDLIPQVQNDERAAAALCALLSQIDSEGESGE